MPEPEVTPYDQFIELIDFANFGLVNREHSHNYTANAEPEQSEVVLHVRNVGFILLNKTPEPPKKGLIHTGIEFAAYRVWQEAEGEKIDRAVKALEPKFLPYFHQQRGIAGNPYCDIYNACFKVPVGEYEFLHRNGTVKSMSKGPLLDYLFVGFTPSSRPIGARPFQYS